MIRVCTPSQSGSGSSSIRSKHSSGTSTTEGTASDLDESERRTNKVTPCPLCSGDYGEGRSRGRNSDRDKEETFEMPL